MVKLACTFFVAGQMRGERVNKNVIMRLMGKG